LEKKKKVLVSLQETLLNNVFFLQKLTKPKSKAAFL
jgi:hypothetical protein